MAYHLDPSWWGRGSQGADRGTKLPRLRLHDLRHTSAVIGLREHGKWPDETSAQLGHSSVPFTVATYDELLPKRGKDIAVAFDRLLEASVGVA